MKSLDIWKGYVKNISILATTLSLQYNEEKKNVVLIERIENRENQRVV